MVATDTGMGEEESHIYLREGAPCEDIAAKVPQVEKDRLSREEEAG